VLAALAVAVWPEPWNARDYALEGAFVGLSLVDLGQAAYGQAHGAIEQNPCVPGAPHPSNGQLVGYFAVYIIGHAGIAWLLPRPWREIWQGLGIGLEVATVLDNARYQSFHVRVPW